MVATRKFGLNLTSKEEGTTAADELRKIATQEEFNNQLIPYDKIFTNEINDYPIEKLESLKESIKTYGLIHNLGVIPVDVDGERRFKLLTGERRYRSIGLLRDEGNDKFPHGVPCRVFSSNLDDVNQEIVLREANELARDSDPERKRKNIERLFELYKMRDAITGDKTTVSEVIAEVTGMGTRQVQRYLAINKDLSDNLKAALDERKINVESAAAFAKLDEISQEEIADILRENNKVTKEEFQVIKAESEKREKELSETLELIKKQKEEETELLLKSQGEVSILEKELQEKEELIKKGDMIKKQLEEELQKKEDNKSDEDLKRIKEESEKEQKKIVEEKEKLDQKLQKKLQEIENLKKELEKSKEELIKKPEVLSKEEKEKLVTEMEITEIQNNIKRGINQLLVKRQTYTKVYSQDIPDIQNLYKELLDKLEELKN